MSVEHNWKSCHLYSDVGLFMEAPERKNKTMLIFQTGLTGSTGFVSFFDHVHLSIIKEPHINANPMQQICVHLRSSAVNILLITIQLVVILKQNTKHHNTIKNLGV